MKIHLNEGPPAITCRALEIMENYCPRTKILIKFFFRSITKTKIPFCTIGHDTFFILIQFLCSLNSLLEKIKNTQFFVIKNDRKSVFMKI